MDENIKDFNCELKAPCFQQLPHEALQFIKSRKAGVAFRKGDNLCKQGTFASYILFITKGIAIQYVENTNDKNFNLRIIKPSEFIGLHSIFSSNTYEYSTLAITDCYAVLIEKEALHKVMQNNSDFTLQLMSKYINENTNLFNTISKLQFKQMNGRLADVLLYIDSLKSDFPDIFQLMSRKQLAEFAGISAESSIKFLKNLEKEGTIRLDNKDIIINNYDALKQLSKLG